MGEGAESIVGHALFPWHVCHNFLMSNPKNAGGDCDSSAAEALKTLLDHRHQGWPPVRFGYKQVRQLKGLRSRGDCFRIRPDMVVCNLGSLKRIHTQNSTIIFGNRPDGSTICSCSSCFCCSSSPSFACSSCSCSCSH